MLSATAQLLVAEGTMSDDDTRVTQLVQRAQRLRRLSIEMLAAAGSGHPGSSLSATDLVTCLYFKVMRHRLDNPAWEDRDRLILYKGHACLVLCAALAEAGYITPDLLTSLRRFGNLLQGHPDRRKLGLVEASTGSLGIGLSLGLGMAFAAASHKLETVVNTGQQAPAKITVAIDSNLQGADIALDDAFVGNTPITLLLRERAHRVRITRQDYQVWEKQEKW